jgi:hypothetical protein
VAAALLTVGDLRPAFTGVEEPFSVPYAPNPFLGCGIDGMLGGQSATAVVATGFTNDKPDALLGGESIMRFHAGGAHRTVTAIKQLIANNCGGRYSLLSTTLGGDESLLLESTDVGTVLPQFAHGVALYYAIVRNGDYLIWLALASSVREAVPTDLPRSLARRGSRRLCLAVTC